MLAKMKTKRKKNEENHTDNMHDAGDDAYVGAGLR